MNKNNVCCHFTLFAHISSSSTAAVAAAANLLIDGVVFLLLLPYSSIINKIVAGRFCCW